MISIRRSAKHELYERRSAIRALNDQLVRGWNEGDAEAFAAPFAEDADFIAFDGTHFKGRREIQRPISRCSIDG